MPHGDVGVLARVEGSACAGMTYTLPEAESANARDSVTCTFVMSYAYDGSATCSGTGMGTRTLPRNVRTGFRSPDADADSCAKNPSPH